MRWPWLPYLLLIPGVLGTACVSGPPPVVRHAIDGDLSDWAGTPALLLDSADATSSELDLGEVKARHDARFFDLMLDLGRSASLQGLSGSLELLIDADGDSSTGETARGMSGVDLIVTFSPRDSSPVKRPGGGATLLRGNLYDLGFGIAPGYAARQVELGFARGGRLPGGPPLFTGNQVTFKVVYFDERGTVRDETQVGTHRLSHFSAQETNPIRELPRPLPGTFRVLSWNVGDHAIRESPERFLHVLRALEPDIIMLDEVTDESSAAEMKALLGGLIAGAGEGGWQVAFGTSGGYQRGVIAIRAPLTQVDRFSRASYPSQARQVLTAMVTDSAARLKLTKSLDDGIGASAATATIGGKRLLLVTLDLWCCGTPSSMEDRRRVAEAGWINRAVRDEMAGSRIDGVVLAGDLNLVATREPLDLLRQGIDLDGSDLEVAEAMQLDGRTNDTWYGPTTPFLPSRIDFSLFSGRTLDVAQAFVFDPRDVPSEWLARHGIDPALVLQATDHLPVVVDYRWK